MWKGKSFRLILISLFFHFIVFEMDTFVRGYPPCGADNLSIRIQQTKNVVDHWGTEEGISIVKKKISLHY